jgi:hypothetical protein
MSRKYYQVIIKGKPDRNLIFPTKAQAQKAMEVIRERMLYELQKLGKDRTEELLGGGDAMEIIEIELDDK